jgi:hypothetical protein
MTVADNFEQAIGEFIAALEIRQVAFNYIREINLKKLHRKFFLLLIDVSPKYFFSLD